MKCAIAMLTNLDVYNKGRVDAGLEPIKIGIGLNTGLCMLGTVGGKTGWKPPSLAMPLTWLHELKE